MGLFKICSELDEARRAQFRQKAQVVARRVNREEIGELVEFIIDNKLSELRFRITTLAEAGNMTEVSRLAESCKAWRELLVEFKTLLNQLSEEPSNKE